MCPTNKKTNSQCVCHCFVVVTVSGNFYRKNLLMRKKGSWCSALPTESSLNVPLENSIPLKWEPDRVLYLLMVIMWWNLEHWDIFRVTGENAGKHIKNGYDVPLRLKAPNKRQKLCGMCVSEKFEQDWDVFDLYQKAVLDSDHNTRVWFVCMSWPQ